LSIPPEAKRERLVYFGQVDAVSVPEPALSVVGLLSMFVALAMCAVAGRHRIRPTPQACPVVVHAGRYTARRHSTAMPRACPVVLHAGR
jgi:hypothetical protein